MRILMISSEMTPFAKTGGLADVVGALPRELVRRGHKVRVFMPLYRSIDRVRFRLLPLLRQIKAEWGHEQIAGEVMRCPAPCDEDVPVYFLHQNFLFGRSGFYGEAGQDYADNDRRFAFLCLAALYSMKALDWPPDIVHLHDWQAGLVAPLLLHHPVIANDAFYSGIRSVFTIHNLAYQGIVSKDVVPKLSLPWTVCTHDGMEYHDAVSLLKAGIVYSHRLTTVSPTYALEIQHAEFGAGLDGVLRARADVLHGILNGIDDIVWNPETDRYLPAHYSSQNLAGKRLCKKELLERYGLSNDIEAPLGGIVSRLVDQKGFDLVREIVPRYLESGARLVVLGTGAREYETFFHGLAESFPTHFGTQIAYDEELAHLIEAGADFFLMPSRFEPSGLNQLYSMRYGTPPIVRRVGGLADSVTDATEANIASNKATGFLFDEYKPEALWDAIHRALEIFRNNPDVWKRIARNGMMRDSSWGRSAEVYESVYEKALMMPR